MSGTIRKRFWANATVETLSDGFGVRLDDRPLRNPSGARLRVRSLDLAAAIASEWRLAGGEPGGVFGPGELVLTALAGTLQDHVEPDRQGAVLRLASYVDGELLCYRASHPSALTAVQRAQWDPWLDWIAARTGIAMRTGEGVMPIRQSAQVGDALRAQIEGLSCAALTGLGVMVPALGSLVLGLALISGQLEAEAAWQLGRLDEDFQARQWGHDREAQAQATRQRAEIAIAGRFVTLAGG